VQNDPVATFESPSSGTHTVVGEVREGAFDLSTLHQQHVPETQRTAETQPIHDSSAAAHASTGVVAGVVDSIASVLPSSEDVHAQLEQAKATIANLTGQANQGLRQRKNEAVSQDATHRGGQTSMGMRHAPPSGVPVPMVAALCLMCFLIAYLLF